MPRKSRFISCYRGENVCARLFPLPTLTLGEIAKHGILEGEGNVCAKSEGHGREGLGAGERRIRGKERTSEGVGWMCVTELHGKKIVCK